MIYQPRNVIPSNVSIDATRSNNLSFEVNTNDKITGYQLTILNWDNTVRYTGNYTAISPNLYNGDTLSMPLPAESYLVNGTNYKWYARLYQSISNIHITYGLIQNISTTTTIYIQSNINIKNGMIIKHNNEERTISSYDNNTGIATVSTAFSIAPVVGSQYDIYSNFIQTVPEYILYMRATPVVTITSIPQIVNKKFYEFTGTYTQSDNVPMVYHIWNLFIDEGNGNLTLVKTSNKEYNSNLTFDYDSLKTGVSYAIDLIVETEYGDVSRSGLQYFTVQYDTIEYLEKPLAHVDCLKNAVQVDWMAPTEFKPVLINNNIASGNILPGTITSNSFYIEKNLQGVTPGCKLNIKNTQSDILSYDSLTGLITINGTLPESAIIGELYFISGESSVAIQDNTTLYRNTPYAGSNSLNTNDYSLLYENNDTEYGIGTYPESYEISMQFKPDAQFFYGTMGIFNDMIPITNIVSDASDGLTGMLTIFAHIYDICAIWPEEVGGVANVKVFPTPPQGETDTTTYAYLAEDIDLTQTSYIYFPDYAYVEKISSFDSSTLKAVFNKELPFIPEAGDDYVMMNTLKTSFYSNPQNTWALQNTAYSQMNLDYRWLDSFNAWDDSKFWVEGGTAIVRIAEYWWKLSVTKDNITLQRGGI